MKNITFLFLVLPLFLFAQEPFITTWQTNANTNLPTSIIIPIDQNLVYNYDVDWENDGVYDDIGVTGFISHDYGVEGTYTVAIRGLFPRIIMNYGTAFEGNQEKLISINQWGDIAWIGSMDGAFGGCSNLVINASDNPNLDNVISMRGAFREISAISSYINNWDVSNVTDMNNLFSQIDSFNQDISNWDVSNVADMSFMFAYSPSFNQDISSWNVSNVTDMHGMFWSSSFNQDIGSWDVSNVQNMSYMFYNDYSFNQNIGNWNVGSVTNMEYMFGGASLTPDFTLAQMSFNQFIGNWDVSNVSNMAYMFHNATAFNQDISNWDVSNVINMSGMLSGGIYVGLEATFNQDISNWDVSNVTNMSGMFKNNLFFNQDISGWNVSNTIAMDEMFRYANSFNQNIGNWDVSNVTNMTQMFEYISLSNNNYNAILESWSQQSLQQNVVFDGGYSQYCTTAKQDIIDNFGWVITDGGATNGCAQSFSDYDALVSFYNSTNGQNWADDSNWLSDEPLGSWKGINLNELDRVSLVYLPSNNLSGQLPISINSLENLEILWLQNNSLTGNIPNEIGDLNNLTLLDLSLNQFSGEIPSSISSLSNLNTLRLKNNNLSNLLPDLSGLNLNSLTISYNDFIFSDLESQFSTLQSSIADFQYTPMNPFTQPETISLVVGEDIVLNASFNNGDSGRLATAAMNEYQWYKDDQLINGAVNSTHTIYNATNADAGIYICRVTNSDVPGLILETSPYFVETSLGVDDYASNFFQLFPNPAKHTLTIKSNDNISIGSVNFYDVLGKRVKDVSVNFENIQITDLSKGIYFLHIQSDLGTVIEKLIIK